MSEHFVIRYSPSLSEAEVDAFEADLRASGVSAELEVLDGRAGFAKEALEVVLQIVTIAGTALLGEAMKSTWSAAGKLASKRLGRRDKAVVVLEAGKRSIVVPAERMTDPGVDCLKVIDTALGAGEIPPSGRIDYDDLPPFAD